ARRALAASAAGAGGRAVTQKSLLDEAAHLVQRRAGSERGRLQPPLQPRNGLLLADGGALVAYALGRQRKWAALQQRSERAGDHFRRGGATGQHHIHLHHFAEGVHTIGQDRNVFVRESILVGGDALPVDLGQQFLGGVQIGQRGDAAVTGAGPQRDQRFAFPAHLLRQVLVLIAADAPGDEAYLRLRNFHFRFFAGLAIQLVVHQHRHVDNLHFLQQIQQWFAYVEDSYLASAADCKPLLG